MAHFPRNPHIAGVFYRCKLIEQWGRGTYDMIKRCKEAGYPRPKFKETVGSFTVVLPFKEPIQRAELQPQEAKLLSSLTERQREILLILKQGTLSRDQIMEQLKQAPAVRTVPVGSFKTRIAQSHYEIRRKRWSVCKMGSQSRVQCAVNAPSTRSQCA